MSVLGVGNIGCGNISASYLGLAPLFGHMEVRAVADLDMEAAETRAREFDVRAETIGGLLSASDVQIIVNLTVLAAHSDVTRRFFGKRQR